jgi:predicted choloylglycine hydrolase
MKTIKLSGDYTEIGQQLADLYKEWGVKPSRDVNHKTLNKQLRIYRKYFPMFVEMYEGIIGNDNRTAALYESLAAGIDRQGGVTKGCSIFGINTDGQCLVGRNYDWVSQARDCFHVYHITPPKPQYRLVGISDMNTYDQQHKSAKHWGFACEDYINEKGLFIGLTFAHCNNIGFGLMPTHIMQLIALTCATTKEALAVFKKAPVAVPKNFFIADQSGDMAVVEHDSKTFRVIRPDSNGVLIHTNHYLSPNFQTEDMAIRVHPAHTTYLRYYEALHLIKSWPTATLREVTKILRNSSYVYANNRHGFQTIWSLAMDMTNKSYDLYFDTASGQTEQKIDWLDKKV